MHRIAAASTILAPLLTASPAGVVIIVFTQADAIAGNVTPGDTPGFPVTLSVAGASYRLGSSLTVTTSVNGIEVRANDVNMTWAASSSPTQAKANSPAYPPSP